MAVQLQVSAMKRWSERRVMNSRPLSSSSILFELFGLMNLVKRTKFNVHDRCSRSYFQSDSNVIYKDIMHMNEFIEDMYIECNSVKYGNPQYDMNTVILPLFQRSYQPIESFRLRLNGIGDIDFVRKSACCFSVSIKEIPMFFGMSQERNQCNFNA